MDGTKKGVEYEEDWVVRVSRMARKGSSGYIVRARNGCKGNTVQRIWDESPRQGNIPWISNGSGGGKMKYGYHNRDRRVTGKWGEGRNRRIG